MESTTESIDLNQTNTTDTSTLENNKPKDIDVKTDNTHNTDNTDKNEPNLDIKELALDTLELEEVSTQNQDNLNIEKLDLEDFSLDNNPVEELKLTEEIDLTPIELSQDNNVKGFVTNETTLLPFL